MLWDMFGFLEQWIFIDLDGSGSISGSAFTATVT